MTLKALVLDANQRSGLAAIRNLGRRNIEITAADATVRTLGGSSKFTSNNFTYPDPTADPPGFVDAVIRACDTRQIDVVFPMTDVTTMLLVQQRERFVSARLACASAKSYESLTDKAALVNLANQLGVPVPDTCIAATTADVLNAADVFGYPIVIKPSRSRYLKNNRIFSTQVRIVYSCQQLERQLESLTWLTDITCLVQRFIPGHGAGNFALANEGKVLARFSHERIREKPPSGGVSVLCQSAALDPKLADYSERLLAAVQWTGPVMVEYRIGENGKPYLMEVNGRFWGSLQLSIDCGIDFPWLMFQLAMQQDVDQPQPYVIGRRLRWLLGDLDNLLLQLRGKDLPGNSKSKACQEFIATFFDGRCRQEIFRWSDPMPSLFELKTWLQALQ